MNNSQVGMDPIPVGSWHRALPDADGGFTIVVEVLVEPSGLA